MNLEQYLIPESSSVSSNIAMLESFIDGAVASLQVNIAMESTNIDDDLSYLADKAKAAGEKMKEGKKKNDETMIYKGSEELREVMEDLKIESSKATTPKSKSRLIQVVKVVGAVLGTVLLTFGAVKAGTKISDTFKYHRNNRLEYETLYPEKGKAQHPFLDDLWQTYCSLCIIPALKGVYHLFGSNYLD